MGYRKLNSIAPDGGCTDAFWDVHHWVAIPLRGEGSYNVYSDKYSDDWISGIAFSKNLWNHAYNSAVAYYWGLNPGTGVPSWSTENWNNDNLAYFPLNTNIEVLVPVMPTGGDKIVYIVEHNNNWMGTQHGNVFINGQPVERFRTTYSNPFATHWNSKIYERYMATRIPANLIQATDKFVRLKIDMTNSNNHIHFREIGTHDYQCCGYALQGFKNNKVTIRGLLRNAINGLTLTDDYLNSQNAKLVFVNQDTKETFNTDFIKNGVYQITCPPGNYKGILTMNDFISTSRSFSVNSDSDESNSLFQILAAPKTPSGAWRLVLSWNDQPKDLDLYVRTPGGETIFYSRKQSSDGKFGLDIDARNGKGPETHTIQPGATGIAKVYVKNYSNEIPLAGSGARVVISYNNENKGEFIVDKVGGSDQRVWYVTDLNVDGGQLVNTKNLLQIDDP